MAEQVPIPPFMKKRPVFVPKNLSAASSSSNAPRDLAHIFARGRPAASSSSGYGPGTNYGRDGPPSLVVAPTTSRKAKFGKKEPVPSRLFSRPATQGLFPWAFDPSEPDMPTEQERAEFAAEVAARSLAAGTPTQERPEFAAHSHAAGTFIENDDGTYTRMGAVLTPGPHAVEPSTSNPVGDWLERPPLPRDYHHSGSSSDEREWN